MDQHIHLELVEDHKGSKSVTFFVTGASVPTDQSLVDELHRTSLVYPDKNIRFLFHESSDSPLHIMLIKEARGLYYPTHVHKNRHEVHYLLEGILSLHIIHSDGSKKQTLLSSVANPQVTSIEPGTPHVAIPISKSVVYLEIKNGPNTDFTAECFVTDLEAQMGPELYQRYLTAGIVLE